MTEPLPVMVWVVCEDCNGAQHYVNPAEKDETPWYWCQDLSRPMLEDTDIVFSVDIDTVEGGHG